MITWSTRCGWSQRALSSNAALLSSPVFLQPTRIERFRWNDIFWTLFDQLFTVKKANKLQYFDWLHYQGSDEIRRHRDKSNSPWPCYWTGSTNHKPSFHCFDPMLFTHLSHCFDLRITNQTFLIKVFYFSISRRCTLLWTSSQTPIPSTAPSSELIWVPRSYLIFEQILRNQALSSL